MCFRRNLVISFVIGLVVLCLAGISFAASDTAKTEASLRAAFPQLKFDSISPSEIPGLYEVDAGQNVLYYYPDKNLIIVGDVVGTDLKSRTAERRSVLRAKLIKELPLDKALKIGDGKKAVIEFTDPDCPYCRKGYEYFTKRTDVTQYIFFSPLAHPGAMPKIEYILSADNKAQAYDAMMMGQEIPASAKPATPEAKALAQEHMALAKQMGIQGTPTYFVKGQEVIGPDAKKLDELLK